VNPLLLLAFPALLAAAPSPLVVGSVRDQYGAPIAGARITVGDATARTDEQGTFALPSSGARQVAIACDYCEPITVSVRAGEPVVALVHRYDALASAAPSERDFAFVPYGRAESAAALAPFTLLENSAQPLPGPQLSDRGLSNRGMLVLADGIPLYDVASNESPFLNFPSHDVERATRLPPGDAFLYGDLAGGGTLLADTRTAQARSGALLDGTSSAARVAQSGSSGAWSAAASHEADDTRIAADVELRAAQGDQSLTFTALAARDRFAPNAQHVDTSNDGFRLDYGSAREQRVDASLTAQNGGYDWGTPATAFSARWSDVQAQAQVATQTRLQVFTGAAIRVSSGAYAAADGSVPPTAGAIAQTRVDAGVQTSGDRYELHAGAAAFTTHYGGGSGTSPATFDAAFVTPSMWGRYELGPQWSYEAQAGASFSLPTILETFVTAPEGPALVLDRNALFEQTLTYSDLHRFRASLTSAHERVSGLDNGFVHAAGAGIAWQVSPLLSLRAWVLRSNNFTHPYEPVYRFGVPVQPATVGSAWLTYERRAVRIDAVYRRDLLDYAGDSHLDASISVPVSSELRIFGATERRAGERYISFGLRTQP